MIRNQQTVRVLFLNFLLLLFAGAVVVGTPLPHRQPQATRHALDQNRIPLLHWTDTVLPLGYSHENTGRRNVPERFQVQFLRYTESDGLNILDRRMSLGEKIKQHFQNLGKSIKEHFQKVGQSIKEHFQKVGQDIKKHFEKVGHDIKQHFEKVGQTLKNVGQKIKQHFQRVGESIKKVAAKAKVFFKKVGEGIKTVGIKIAKFAVKAAAVVHTWTGKVVGLVCKPLGRAIQAGAAAEGMLADKLNSLDTHQSEKERKAWNGLDIAQKPMKYLAKKMVDSAKKAGNPALVKTATAAGVALEAAF